VKLTTLVPSADVKNHRSHSSTLPICFHDVYRDLTFNTQIIPLIKNALQQLSSPDFIKTSLIFMFNIP
jgi:hypothetical protein